MPVVEPVFYSHWARFSLLTERERKKRGAGDVKTNKPFTPCGWRERAAGGWPRSPFQQGRDRGRDVSVHGRHPHPLGASAGIAMRVVWDKLDPSGRIPPRLPVTTHPPPREHETPMVGCAALISLYLTMIFRYLLPLSAKIKRVKINAMAKSYALILVVGLFWATAVKASVFTLTGSDSVGLLSFNADTLAITGGAVQSSVGARNDLAFNKTGRLFGISNSTPLEFDPVTLAIKNEQIFSGITRGIAATIPEPSSYMVLLGTTLILIRHLGTAVYRRLSLFL